MPSRDGAGMKLINKDKHANNGRRIKHVDVKEEHFNVKGATSREEQPCYVVQSRRHTQSYATTKIQGWFFHFYGRKHLRPKYTKAADAYLYTMLHKLQHSAHPEIKA